MTVAARGWLRVDVAPAELRSERWISIAANDGTHRVKVDRHDVNGDALRVAVIYERGDDVLIELPASAVDCQRVVVPKSSVCVDRTPTGWAAWVVLAVVVLVVCLGGWALVRALE